MSLLSDIVGVSVETGSLSVYVQHAISPVSRCNIYASHSGSRHNRLATPARTPARPPGKYRRVQPPVSSISTGQTRSLRLENCLALSISISRASYSACDVTQLPLPPPAAAASKSSSPLQERRALCGANCAINAARTADTVTTADNDDNAVSSRLITLDHM